MILRRIRLSRVACFLEGVETDPLDPGLNILAANNEEGKSTLVRAAARALFDRYSGKSQEIRNLQPAGTDLGPRVTVEFSNGREVFRLEKQFLQSAGSRLYRKNNDKWDLLAEGDKADRRTLELAGGEQPGAGATKPQHWGFLRYLWARQEEPAAWPSWDGNAGGRVRATLARVEVDPVADSLEAALTGRFHECFTPNGQVKRNGPLHALTGELEALEAELAEVAAGRLRLEEQQEAFGRLSEELRVLRGEKERTREEADRLIEAARRAESASREVRTLQKALAEADERLQAVDRDAEKRKRTESEQAANREKTEAAEARVERLQRIRRELEERLARVEREGRGVEQAVRRLKAEQAGVQLRLRIAAARESLAEKKELLEKIEAREAELQAKERDRAGLPRLSGKRLEALRALAGEIRDLKNRLAAAGLAVSVTAAQDRTMETDTPEEGRRSHRLEGGKSADFAAARELVVHLPEWGRIEIRSGAAEVREKQQALETAKENLAAALRELGTERFEDLEVACARARELDADLKNLRQGIGDVLGRFGSADDLRRTVREEEAALGKLLESNAAGDGPDGCDPDELRRRDRENERKRQSLEEEHAAKQREAEQLRRDLTANSRECGEAEGERNRLRTAAVVLETRLKEMAERYGDGGLEEARRRAGREFVQAEARLEEAKRLLPEDWEALPGRRDRAVKAASEAGAEHDRRREALLRMEGEMRQRGSEGLYSREVRLREKIALKREEAGALRRRSGAAGFLATLLGFRKREAFERVLAPLEEQLSVQFGELTGRRERRVFLDENLQVTGVGRDRESGIPFESLSQGAREQLLLALRAAVALELAEEEPQVLILDDVLVNTDPTRQQRVLDFLESLARRVQILVLTCHPDRYRGVGQRLALHPVREDETGTPG